MTGCWDGARWSPNAAGWRGTANQVYPELVATAPACVGRRGTRRPVRGHYFDAYVIIDIYSRYLVGVRVVHESGVLARELMEQIFRVHGVPQVVHADRGFYDHRQDNWPPSSLISKYPVAFAASAVSNNNPSSESLFRALKSGPVSPVLGADLGGKAIHEHLHPLVRHQRRHTGIGLHTPADVHFGLATDKAADRRTVLTQAPTSARSAWWGRRNPDLPDTAWINRPARTPPGDRHDSRLTPAGLIHLEKFRRPGQNAPK